MNISGYVSMFWLEYGWNMSRIKRRKSEPKDT